MTDDALPDRVRTRLRQWLEAPDGPDEVQNMSAEDLIAFVRRVGVPDVAEWVTYATADQLTGAFDHDVFVNDAPGMRESFDPARFIVWLEVLLEAGDARCADQLSELDEDFLVHALSEFVLVFDHSSMRARFEAEPQSSFRIEKALRSAHLEDIEDYTLISKVADGWSAVWSLLLALDQHHHALLSSLLERLAFLSQEHLDDLDRLAGVLTAPESMAEQVEAAREERLIRRGFVEPRAARAFLLLAAEDVDPEERDPVTRRYFRRFDAPTQDASDARANDLPALDSPPRALWDALMDALGRLAQSAPAVHAERMTELAYLANVLVAGASLDDQRLTLPEATEAALATVARGLGLQMGASQVRPAEVEALLRRRAADVLFRHGARGLDPPFIFKDDLERESD